MARKLKKTRKSRRARTRGTSLRAAPGTKSKATSRAHRFGELHIPEDAQVKDSCYIESDDVNESMDMWWSYDG